MIKTFYKTIKQILETILKTNSQAFRDAVLVEYPRKGAWVIGFTTGEVKGEVKKKLRTNLINVFIPTTPNPTSGFLLMIPKKDLKYLDVSVDEAIKTIVSACTKNTLNRRPIRRLKYVSQKYGKIKNSGMVRMSRMMIQTFDSDTGRL